MPLLTRLAPTPSGFLHIGNMCSFVLTWALARGVGAKILLRIDDLDSERVRPEYIDDIFRTIDRLGINYDTGPSGGDDFNSNWSQQHRLPLYEDLLARLTATGNVFACNLSRKVIREGAPGGQYPLAGREQDLSLEMQDVSWRIITPDEICHWEDLGGNGRAINLFQVMRDFVIRRRDGVPSYQVASLADDLHFGVNLIVRGEDLLPSTAAQLYLAGLLGKKRFKNSTFFHHPLIADMQGRKLSKSTASVRQLSRPDKVNKAFIYNQVKVWLDHPAIPETALKVLENWRK